jgi:hypothetical protein
MQNTEQLTFEGVAPDLQQLVVNNPALELDDLAKAARTCKFFSKVASERCAAEEQWLTQAAMSAFGERLIELLLFVLTDPVAKDRSDEEFDLTTGEPFPSIDDLPGRRHIVLLAAPQGPHQCDPIDWHIRKYGGSVYVSPVDHNEVSMRITVCFEHDQDEVFVSYLAPPSALMIPYMGLSLLAFKHVRAKQTTAGRSPFHSRRQELPRQRVIDHPDACSMSRFMLEYIVLELGQCRRETRPLPDVTRAMKFLRMVAWHCRSRLRYFHAVRPLQLLDFGPFIPHVSAGLCCGHSC